MKNDTLQQLLAKYQQGTLSGEELEQLNILTHKDEVMGVAEGRARTIIRRRTWRSVGLVCAALAFVGAGVWALNPAQEAPIVAELTNAEPQVVEDAILHENVSAPVQQAVPKAIRSPKASQPVAQNAAVQNIEPQVENIAVESSREEPTVVCNNQCDADSVINDIWKFLTA